jgi:hypothetical protein
MESLLRLASSQHRESALLEVWHPDLRLKPQLIPVLQLPELVPMEWRLQRV